MPELPEVETIRVGLEKYLVGRKVVVVDVRLKKILSGDVAKIIGAKFRKVRRFGKALSLDLDNGYSIAVHVKMTGQLVYRDARISRVPKVSLVSRALIGELPNKFTHVIFELDDGARLYYNDVRQFGWLKILPTEDVEKMPFVRELGPEPPVTDRVKDRKILTFEKFKEIVSGKNTKIKVLLMDQKKIGGVGNIYANEALFLAGIDPRRVAKTLSGNEVGKLYSVILKVLKLGLRYGGASENTYVNALGQQGGYQDRFLVYGYHKKPCLKCGNKISVIKLGGRGTFYCPQCQK